MSNLSRERMREIAADKVRHLALGWLIAVFIEYLLLPENLRNLEGLDGLAKMSFLRVLWMTCGIAVFLAGISRIAKIKTAERWGIVVCFAGLAAASLRASSGGMFPGALAAILVFLVIYAVRGWNSSREPSVQAKRSHRAFVWITAGLTVAFFLFVCAWTIGRVYSFSSPTFDFGIFSQMFYYMKKCGLPMTTVERDGLLSHFAVHVSPAYYFMLPLYLIFPTPATLQAAQAAVLASAVIPLWKIGRHHGLTGVQRMLVCAALLLLPAYSGGTGYDIHENCFLTPWLLWLFYGIDTKNKRITALFAVLVLMVKEDAAVYVAVIGLWLIVTAVLPFSDRESREQNREMLLTGIALFLGSAAVFAVVTGYLAGSGDGLMTNRYNNLLYDGASPLFAIVKAILLFPMKIIYECADPNKREFLLLTWIPILGLPLMTRHYERFLLLIPYLLVNLIPDYSYQHDILFQYTFGSNACLMYLTVRNMAEWKAEWKRTVCLAAAAAVCAGFFGSVVVPKAIRYPIRAGENWAYYEEIRNVLDQIPKEAPVTATTFYTAHLSQRDILYDVQYCSREHLLEMEYVVLSVSSVNPYKKYATGGKDNGYENLVALLEEEGYEVFQSIPSVLVIYRKAQTF